MLHKSSGIPVNWFSGGKEEKKREKKKEKRGGEKNKRKRKGEKKPWFVMFADFSSVNMIMMANFKLPKI